LDTIDTAHQICPKRITAAPFEHSETIRDMEGKNSLEFEEPEIANTFYDVVDSQGRNKKI